MENKNTPAVQTAKKSAKSFFSALNSRRKRLAFRVTMMMATMMATAATAFADGKAPTNAGEQQFNDIIKLFADWIGRIGLVVSFVGAIMFALSIKNEDAEAKTRGLMTLASGVVVFAVTKSLDLFGVLG